MSDDLLITPGSRKLEIKDSSGNVDAKIETDASGNLAITNAGGDISIGDTSSDVFIGDGSNNVDIVFEQDGEIRGTSGVTLTLGASGSNVRMASDLNLNGNDITGAGDITLTGNLNITGDINSASVTDLDVTDKTITLGVGQNEASSGGSGIVVAGSLAELKWDESDNRWEFNKNLAANVFQGTGSSNSSFYGINVTRSSSGLTTPDICGSSGTLVLGTSTSDERLALSTDGALIYGRALVRNASSDQNTSQDSASIPDTTGPEIMRFEGGYTNGQYTTEFAKVDRSGNLPLYVRQSLGTANSFSNIARFGNHGQTNGSDVFAVFGNARVNGTTTTQNLTISSLSAQNSETTVLTINGSNVVGKRDLGSNAFNSTTIPTNNNQLTNGAGYITSSNSAITNKLPLAGGTMTGTLTMGGNTITGSNFNISGVNALTINDPGEGIIFTGTNTVSLFAVDDATDSIMKFNNATKLLVHNDRVLAASEQNVNTNSTGTSSTDFVTVYHVNGSNLASHVRLAITGTTSNVVVNVVADIHVNHSQDIFIKSVSGNYTQVDIKVTSNNNEDFAIEVKRTDSNTGVASLRYSLVPITKDTTISQVSSHSFTGSSLTHRTKPGTYQSATSDAAHGYFPSLRVENKVMHDGDTDTNIQFDNNRVRIFAGNVVYLDTDNGTNVLHTGSSLAASQITSGTFADARIPSLSASKITSGSFAAARIPSLPASQITSGSFDAARIPSLPASQITSGTFANARISSASISQHGYITGLSFNALSGKTSGTGDYSTSGDLVAGRGSGSIAMTINDGYGNSNLTFNHQDGTPDQAGNSARIEVNTDSSSDAHMSLEVKTNVSSGVAVQTATGMQIRETQVDIPEYLRHLSDTDTYIRFTANRVRIVAGNTTKFDSNDTYLTGITSSMVTTALGYTPPTAIAGVSTNADLRLVFSNAGAPQTDAHGDLSYNPSTNLLNINGAFIQGPATSQVFSYAPHLSAASASIQLTFGRTTDATGTGAIGADSTNCFAAWNTTSVGQRFRVTHAGDAYIVGDLYVPDRIRHEGDSNTYMQFHAADQWRVVTGGSERLEVNNTRTTVNNGYLQITGSTSHQIPTASATAHTIRLGNIATHVSGMVIDTTSTAVTGTKRCYTIKNNSGDALLFGNEDDPDILQVHNEGHVAVGGDFSVPQTNKIEFDGPGGHTYMSEESNSNLKTYVSGTEMLNTTNDGHFFSGFVQVPEYIYHKGDTHTYIRFRGDRITAFAGNVEMLDIVENGAGTATYVDICDRVRVQRDGDLLCEGDVIANSSTAISDRKLKENIKPITNAVEKVMTLGGVTYNWKKDGGISAGVIAQDVEEVLPEVVKEKVGKDGEEFKTVNYDGLVGLLIEGMKEQQTIINRLEERINTLEKERE